MTLVVRHISGFLSLKFFFIEHISGRLFNVQFDELCKKFRHLFFNMPEMNLFQTVLGYS